MKSLAPIALFLCSFAAFAEDAEQPMEQTGPIGVVAFFGVVILACVWFFIAMNKNAKKQADIKAAETK